VGRHLCRLMRIPMCIVASEAERGQTLTGERADDVIRDMNGGGDFRTRELERDMSRYCHHCDCHHHYHHHPCIYVFNAFSFRGPRNPKVSTHLPTYLGEPRSTKMNRCAAEQLTRPTHLSTRELRPEIPHLLPWSLAKGGKTPSTGSYPFTQQSIL